MNATSLSRRLGLRVRTIILISITGAMALLFSSCRKAAPPSTASSRVLAQVGESVITAEQFQKQLRQRTPSVSIDGKPNVLKESVLDEMVQFEALYTQACKAGWNTNVELLAGFKRSIVARFQEEQLAQAGLSAPTEAEIREYYEQHAGKFTRVEQVRGAVIVFETPAKATPEKRSEAVARVTEVREQALKGAAGQQHFGLVAQRHSIDQATRYAGGDFGLLTPSEVEGRYGAELARALAALKSPGAVSAVMETPRGLGFVKLIERRAESRRPLAEVRDGIAYQLAKAKQTQAALDFQASVRRGVEVRINHALLDTIPLPVRHDEPPSTPGTETAKINQ